MRIASTHKTTWKRRRPRYQLITMRRQEGVRFFPHLTGRRGGPKYVVRPSWRWVWWRPRSLLGRVAFRAYHLPPLTPSRERPPSHTP